MVDGVYWDCKVVQVMRSFDVCILIFMINNASDTSVRVAGKEDVSVVQALAGKIWPATYASILNPAQIDYMMNRIYSRESLQQQMDEYHHIFLILDYESKPSGFASYSPYGSGGKWKLEKIYVDPALQGKGLGKFLLEEVVDRVKAAGGKTLALNVNRHNKARSFYEKQGFDVVKVVDIDIGNGYFMNDYVMEMDVS